MTFHRPNPKHILILDDTAAKMGKHFGALGVKVSGIVSYSLSPFEQRAFANAVKIGIPNIIKRIRGQALIVAPPLVAGYMIYDWGNKEYLRLCRKNPDDYANDE